MNNEFSLELNVILEISSKQFSPSNPLVQWGKIDWKLFLQLVKEHRINSFILSQLTFGKFNIPKIYRNPISAESKRARLRMLLFSAEIAKLSQHLRILKIDCIFLKGPVAAQQIYNDFTAKESRDIDLLIKETDLIQMISFLEKENYKCTYPFTDLNTKQRTYYRKTNNQLAFFNREKKIQLEVHWRLFANPQLLNIPFKELLNKSEKVKIGNSIVKGLGSEHLVLLLAVHGSKHKWSKLYWLLEFSFYLNNHSFKLKDILDQAKLFGVERSLLQALILTHKLFNVSHVSEFVKDQKKDYNLDRIISFAITEISKREKEKKNQDLNSYWNQLFYNLKLKRSFNYKLAYFKLISHNDFQVINLPSKLFFLYYPLRPILWFQRNITQQKS